MKRLLDRIVEKAGEPPVCAGPDEIHTAIIGMPFSVDIAASDPDGVITGIKADLPPWATLNMITELPSPDAVALISGSPGAEDKGIHVMTVAATDNEGNQAVSPFKIEVVDYGFYDGHPGVF